jgi:hypothetical protein
MHPHVSFILLALSFDTTSPQLLTTCVFSSVPSLSLSCQGARNGPSLMPGCTREVYDVLAPIITKCAAQVDDGPCTTYLGPVGAGNYVKMVHNGIEYGEALDNGKYNIASIFSFL